MELRGFIVLFIVLAVDAEEKKFDCIDARRTLRCVYPENCPEGKLLPHKTCFSERVCCRKNRPNPYLPLREISQRLGESPVKEKSPEQRALPQLQTFPFRTKSSILNKGRMVFPDDIKYLKYDTAPPKKVDTVMNNNKNSVFNSEDSVTDSKSVKYCKRYSKLSKDYLHAMPLLPEVIPLVIEMENCEPNFTPLIVGGKNAVEGEFPHMAALGFNRSNDIDYLCGGTLISEKFILTAAHCTVTRWGPPIVAFLGSISLDSPEGHRVDIARSFPHPEYKPPSCYHDIALLELTNKLKLSSKLRPACLPSLETKGKYPRNVAIATGWGKTGIGKESSSVLLKVPLDIIDNHKCNDYYESDSKTPKLYHGITSSLICAGGNTKHFNYDTCQGDSGGPLQTYLPENRCMVQVVGVTSFGKSCGAGIPGVYTKVTPYIPWIESIVWP